MAHEKKRTKISCAFFVRNFREQKIFATFAQGREILIPMTFPDNYHSYSVMSKELKNPFIVEGYAGDKYFCDRVEETHTLIQALESGRNVTLISPRRMGKSGLIHHTFEKLRNDCPGIRFFYIDIFHTHTLAEFINVFASTILGTLESSVEKLYATARELFRRCRPVITADAITGLPQLTLNIEHDQEEHTLKEIFTYLQSSGKRIYIAFDEFQQIAEYPEKGVEALLRSFIQFTNNVSFIFAGSKMHVMQQMFSLPARPFYQSTQTMVLRPISFEAYQEFASRLFHEGDKELYPEGFRTIYDMTCGHTWYVQYWLSRLYDDTTADASAEGATRVLDRILAEEDENFYMYLRLLTKAQRDVITAVATNGSLRPPFTHDMISEMQLPPASTTRSCLEKLLDKELLMEERGAYTVYNRFFSLWLKKHHGE